MSTPAVLVVGGVDPTGGAGVTQDVATLSALEVRTGTIVSCLTAQDDEQVSLVQPVSDQLFAAQIESAIRVLGRSIGAVKTGLIATRFQAELVALETNRIGCPLIVDPILRAGNGSSLHGDFDSTMQPLLDAASVLTPNLDEAERLARRAWDRTWEDLAELARELSTPSRDVVLSAGHARSGEHADEVSVVIYAHGATRAVQVERRKNVETHGTGCALASALSGFLALGESIDQAAESAHRFVSRAILRARGTGGRRLCPEPWHARRAERTE